MHDIYRQDKGGRPTFDHVIRAAELLKKHHVEFSTLICVNAAIAEHVLEVYQFLRDNIGSHFMQFIPIVERDNETSV